MHKEFKKLLEIYPWKIDDMFYIRRILAYYKKTWIIWNTDIFAPSQFLLTDDLKIFAFVFIKLKTNIQIIIPVNKLEKFNDYLKIWDLEKLDKNLQIYITENIEEVHERKKEFFENEKKLDSDFEKKLIDYQNFFDIKEYLK